tara:strand:- start:4502 stop:5197 length:696 start_codon:yes stop_codon:yes gene_type:complete
MNTAILIPARLESKRYANKMLVELDGKPMIKYVYDACVETGYDTFVVTDSMEIFSLFDAQYCWIEEKPYENGTARCAGAISSRFFKAYDTFVNVQGDMPDVTANMINQCVDWLKHYSVSTVYTTMRKEEQDRPESVKMVRAGDKALWFGRGMTGYGDWHLGVYGYRREALELYPTLEVPIEEDVEKLEQLRWLKNGWDIGCSHVEFNGTEINTQEDIYEWNYKHGFEYKNG